MKRIKGARETFFEMLLILRDTEQDTIFCFAPLFQPFLHVKMLKANITAILQAEHCKHQARPVQPKALADGKSGGLDWGSVGEIQVSGSGLPLLSLGQY